MTFVKIEASVKKLVVVESPGKVKSISQYLGPDYIVLASYGHIRNLPSRTGAVDPAQDFAMVWELSPKASSALKPIVEALKTSDTLILATDLDREGEAISWHLLEYLRQSKKISKDTVIQRVSFNAITKTEILKAVANPRTLDLHLIEAYLARLSLDYLVGFTLSPVLWRKLPGARSAGRVQSVALRLIVERERAITTFFSQEYWSIHGLFCQGSLTAQLTHVQGKKLAKLDIGNDADAKAHEEALRQQTYTLTDSQTKTVQRHPAPPFMTSSLQQEASRKLGYSPARTMQLAQRLYEGTDIGGEQVGLITYMRTDSVFITPEAVTQIRDRIQKQYGAKYVPSSPRLYKLKGRAQEAHEAIRPAQMNHDPAAIKGYLPEDQWALYKLIWDRALASQMASATYEQTALVIQSVNEAYGFRATGSRLIFDGFLALYEESKEANKEANKEGEEGADRSNDRGNDKAAQPFPLLSVGQGLALEDLRSDQHFTQPPPRFSEASLVQELEELGIGRPSTYARILQVLQEREYVALERKRLIPLERGVVVTTFLCQFFAHYVDYQFTAQLEEQLDNVSQGQMPWKSLLEDFWPLFWETAQTTQELKMVDVLEALSPALLEGKDATCPKCKEGKLSLKISKMGPYFGCSNYPTCQNSQDLSGESSAPSSLGQNEVGEEIFVKKGPYGWYVQGGEKRAAIPNTINPQDLTLDYALWLLSLPLVLGQHSETGHDVAVGIGRFGPYVKYDGKFYSVKDEGLWSWTVGQAVAFIAQKETKAAKDSAKGFAKGGAKRGVKSAISKSTEVKGAAVKSTVRSKKTASVVKKGQDSGIGEASDGASIEKVKVLKSKTLVTKALVTKRVGKTTKTPA